MARETVTVQCYPSDSAVNEKVSVYESFGWELINNQRCQEYEGQTSDGSTITNHYSTFNKLTFSREKSNKWYTEVVALESEYTTLMKSEPYDYSYKPSKGWLLYGIVGLVIAVCGALMFWGMELLSYIWYVPCGLAVIGVILLIVYIVKNKKYKNMHAAYLARKRDWDNTTKKEAEKIRNKAAALVNE